MILLPLNNQPNQFFGATIPLGNINIRLSFSLSWNEIAGYWELSIANVETSEQLIVNFPMVSNEAPYRNILRQFEYFNIGKAFLVKISNSARNYPGVGDWGENFVLLWGQ